MARKLGVASKVKVAKRGVKVEVCTMDRDAGRISPDPTPTPPRRASRTAARSPLVPPPAGKGIRSTPVVLPPREGKPARLPIDAPEGKRRFNRLGIILALVVCVGTIPFTYQFQKNRVGPKNPVQQKTNYEIPVEKRQWRMKNLEGLTEKQATSRFGTPSISRNYNLSDGSFAGPAVGQKRFYAKTLPNYGTLTKDAETVWGFPQYVVIREVIWQLPDSYLTIWMREPRAEIDISDDAGIVALPTAPDGGGDWVVIDNFRVGKDLVKTPPEKTP